MVKLHESRANKLKKMTEESISKLKIKAVLTNEGEMIPVEWNEVKIEPIEGTLEVTHIIIDGTLYEVEQ